MFVVNCVYMYMWVWEKEIDWENEKDWEREWKRGKRGEGGGVWGCFVVMVMD